MTSGRSPSRQHWFFRERLIITKPSLSIAALYKNRWQALRSLAIGQGKKEKTLREGYWAIVLPLNHIYCD